MKKLSVIVSVALATTFCACTNSSTSANSDQDTMTTAEVDAIVDEDLSELLDEIAGDVEAQDADALQSSIEAFKARIQALINAGNDAVAQKYLESLQGFLTTNKEQVAAISTTVAESAETTVENLVQKMANLPLDVAKTAQDAAEDVANAAVNKANETVNAAKTEAETKAKEAVEAQKQKANDAIDAQQQKANDAINKAADDVKKQLGL